MKKPFIMFLILYDYISETIICIIFISQIFLSRFKLKNRNEKIKIKKKKL